jgi:hypothetical protein
VAGNSALGYQHNMLSPLGSGLDMTLTVGYSVTLAGEGSYGLVRCEEGDRR